MPELSRVLGGPRRGWALGWAIAVAACVLPAFASAESVPASVRACGTEADPGRRLACYDREIARFPEPSAPVAATAAKPPAAAAAGKTATVKAQTGSGSSASDSSSIAGSSATTAGSSSTTTATTSTAPASSSTTAAATDRPGAAEQPKAAAQQDRTAAKDAGHLSAHVVSIERLPNEMVLHLDNGQVWQEIQSTSGDLSLREGDLVKIDKQLGSYWLSGPHVSGMKVRQKS
jgi:hypothetical protein